MNAFCEAELLEAKQSIASTLNKCEKAIVKLKAGSSQHTLTKRRINAFKIALTLVEEQIDKVTGKY